MNGWAVSNVPRPGVFDSAGSIGVDTYAKIKVRQRVERGDAIHDDAGQTGVDATNQHIGCRNVPNGLRMETGSAVIFVPMPMSLAVLSTTSTFLR